MSVNIPYAWVRDMYIYGPKDDSMIEVTHKIADDLAIPREKFDQFCDYIGRINDFSYLSGESDGNQEGYTQGYQDAKESELS